MRRQGNYAFRDRRQLRELAYVGCRVSSAQQACAVANHCFENGIFVRAVGDTLILSPPLIINEEQIGQIADGIKSGVRSL